MPAEDSIWISMCSRHMEKKNYECSLCKAGYYMSYKELDEDQDLFNNDYPAWYKKHNNGEELSESALETWRSIKSKERK